MNTTEFLRARLDEDEEAARAILQLDFSEGHWIWATHNLPPYRSALMNERGTVVLPSKHDDVYPSAAVAAHITRHDPARVLAEVEAKRQIVELAEQTTGIGDEILRALALPYAAHPDYDPAWRP